MFGTALEKAYKRKTEEQLYNKVAEELYQGKKHDATWAKALANGREDNEIQGLYIKYRVQSLIDDSIIEEKKMDIQKVESKKRKKAQQRTQQRKKFIDKVKDTIFVYSIAIIVVGVGIFILSIFY